MLAIARNHIRRPGVQLLQPALFEQTIPDAPVPMARRWLGNEEHRIVKVFYTPQELTDRLANRGWSAEVHRIGDRFLAGSPSAEQHLCERNRRR